MLMNQPWLSSDYRRLIALTVPFALSTILGCGGGEGGPVTSHLSTTPSTEADSSTEIEAQSSDNELLSDDLHNGDGEAPVATLDSIPEDGNASLTADADSTDEQATDNPPPSPPTGLPVVALHSTPTGASAEVTWQPTQDSQVSGYYIYFGRQSAEEPGVCSYEGRYTVDSPSVTISDLEPNTPYFFAVSSYSTFESPCSSETAIVTPPAGA
jgi:hypothetical protein